MMKKKAIFMSVFLLAAITMVYGGPKEDAESVIKSAKEKKTLATPYKDKDSVVKNDYTRASKYLDTCDVYMRTGQYVQAKSMANTAGLMFDKIITKYGAGAASTSGNTGTVKTTEDPAKKNAEANVQKAKDLYAEKEKTTGKSDQYLRTAATYISRAETYLKSKNYKSAESNAGTALTYLNRIKGSTAAAKEPAVDPKKAEAEQKISEAKKLHEEKKALLNGVRNADFYNGEANLKNAETYYSRKTYQYAVTYADKSIALFKKIEARTSGNEEYKDQADKLLKDIEALKVAKARYKSNYLYRTADRDYNNAMSMYKGGNYRSSVQFAEKAKVNLEKLPK